MRKTFVLYVVLAIVFFGGCEKEPDSPKPVPVAAKPQAAGVHPFNGKDFTGWRFEGRPKRNFWKVGAAAVDPANKLTLKVGEGGADLINAGFTGSDILTEQKFADHRIELEFMLPPEGNSGVFVQGQYELQVLHDPKAKEATHMDVGGVARLIAPKVLAPIEPGKWHKYEIDFRAPRFDAEGNKTQNAKLVRVAIDGVLLHENVEVPGPTDAALVTGKEFAEGPLLLQGSEGPVAYRNIVVTPTP